MPATNPTESAANLIAALQRGPKTRDQLAQSVGIGTNSVDRWLNAFHDAGVIRIGGEQDNAGQGTRARIWEIQRTPFELPDWNARKSRRNPAPDEQDLRQNMRQDAAA